MSDKNEIDEVSGIETTGHEWDGIKELNNPLPKWWLWTFYATIVFSVGYMIWYPAVPMISTATAGISGETNRSVLIEQMAEAKAERADQLAALGEGELEVINTDADLRRFAIAGGASLYKVHCSQCHGSGAQGGPGYPNLSDDAWIWGGDLAAIQHTIAHGVRNEQSDEARDSMMPAFGADEILTGGEIGQVTAYVLSLSGSDHDADEAATGAEIYADNCASCHGDDGQGLRDLGAPNLADALWLYGGTREEIARQIYRPRHGVMPAWGLRLSETDIKQLALYVHSLGGGEAAVE